MAEVRSCSASMPEPTQVSYQETPRFCTWRKHVRDLYQQLVHVDLVWETPAAQLMPYVTVKDDTSTHTLLTGTRTGGAEQAYLQMLSVTMPNGAQSLDEISRPFCEATGEVGGYGMSSSHCGLRVERRILHDGDVLAARYMHGNPLIIGSSSSDGNVYVFDWSRVSLNKYPNDPARPRAPLPPNELSSNPTDEEKLNYQKRMRALNAVSLEQERWDRRTGEGQHVLKLTGGGSPSDNLDWSTSMEGLVASGSRGRVCVWKVANMSKDESRVVKPCETFALDDEEERITSLNFVCGAADEFLCCSTSGSVYYNDLRARQSSEIFSLPIAATCLSVSMTDPTALLVGDDDGSVHFFDLRNSAKPVMVNEVHDGEVTTVQWCPHSRHLFSTGGSDGNVCMFNHTSSHLLFRHAGHTDAIMDLQWNWQEASAGQMLSVDCNSLMLWRPRDYFFTH